MTVLQNGKRRASGSEALVRSFGKARTCTVEGCTTRLSRYNPTRCCSLHRGWDREQATRRRRRRASGAGAAGPTDDRPAA